MAGVGGRSVGVGDTGGVLPCVEHMVDDFGQAESVFDLGEDDGTGAAHVACVAGHDFEVGADGWGEVGFVDDEQVALGEAGSAFAGDFVAAGDVDDLDGEVGEFAAEAGGEVIAAGFEEEEVGVMEAVQFFEGEEVGGDILADGGVRAAAGFDGSDTVRGEGLMADEEFAVFAGEDVVGDGGEAEAVAEGEAELEHEGGFAGADGATDADGEGAGGEVAVEGPFAIVEVAGVLEARVSVRGIVVVMMRVVVVGGRHGVRVSGDGFGGRWG